jgi:4,5-DOPA dioxygenase extradiol
MPVLFVGHGSPMNVIADNEWSRGFSELAREVPLPRAILAVSAHWFVDGTFVTTDARPKTIHDFYGFPEALYQIQYPAPGDPALAGRIRALLGERVAPSGEWGLDHGTWTVLRFMYPEARVPVLQLSIDRRLAPADHIELAGALSPLRDEGVLILGSGNIVHNLRDAMTRLRAGGQSATPDWAQRFDTKVAEALQRRDTAAVRDMWPNTDDGRMAHPSPDHFFPLLYSYGAADERDRVTFPVVGFDAGSLSMRSILFAPA